MVRWAARLLLLRVLPGRLVPLLTVVELAMLARGLLRGRRNGDGLVPAAPGTADTERLPPWREFGRPRSADVRPGRHGRAEVGPEAGATLRR